MVFLVDEIGQYIGEDSKLMLNLQTVTEELGKECMGKAWVIVTSQQDIDSITNVKGNDFSKIQGRFSTAFSHQLRAADSLMKPMPDSTSTTVSWIGGRYSVQYRCQKRFQQQTGQGRHRQCFLKGVQ